MKKEALVKGSIEINNQKAASTKDNTKGKTMKAANRKEKNVKAEVKEVFQTATGYYKTCSGCRANAGNEKIGKDTCCINISSAQGCSSRRLKLCQLIAFNLKMKKQGKRERGECYGIRDERVYPGTLAAHLEQESYWENTDAERRFHDVINLICFFMLKNPNESRYFVRPDVVGEFRNQEDIDFWIRVANVVWKAYGIVVYTYTARSDLDWSYLPEHMIVKSSGSVDFTGCGCFEIIASDAEVPAGTVLCPGDCYGCMFCKVRGIHVVNRNHAKRTVKAA